MTRVSHVPWITELIWDKRQKHKTVTNTINYIVYVETRDNTARSAVYLLHNMAAVRNSRETRGYVESNESAYKLMLLQCTRPADVLEKTFNSTEL